MRGHYFLLFLSAYLVACLLAMSAPALNGFTDGFRLIGVGVALALLAGAGGWLLTFAPTQNIPTSTHGETDWDAPAFAQEGDEAEQKVLAL